MLLTGSKLGCSEGGCGACTVLLSRVDPSSKKMIHSSVNACLTPVLATDSCHITTIEGIGTIQNLHPIQKAMVEMHGSQCGKLKNIKEISKSIWSEHKLSQMILKN